MFRVGWIYGRSMPWWGYIGRVCERGCHQPGLPARPRPYLASLKWCNLSCLPPCTSWARAKRICVYAASPSWAKEPKHWLTCGSARSSRPSCAVGSRAPEIQPFRSYSQGQAEALFLATGGQDRSQASVTNALSCMPRAQSSCRAALASALIHNERPRESKREVEQGFTK
jgi:hypothetical protein